MKDPTLHITRSALVKILSEVKFSARTGPKVLANKIFEQAQPYQIRNRTIVKGNKKVRTKIDRLKKAENPIVPVFNRILMAVRMKLKHKGIKAINKESSQYITLVEVSNLAYQFSEDFDIVPREDGYKLFCELGISMMGRVYGLNKFKYLSEKITQRCADMVEVLHDPKVEDTKEFYEAWKLILIKYTGIEKDIQISDYTEYIHFVEGRKLADQYEADYTEWIEAQFAELAFLNTVPELAQLSTENACTRYERFVTKQSVKADDGSVPEEFTSDKESEYFKKLNG